MAYFSNQSANLYYEIHETGEPLLIIPGGGADGRYYSPIVDLLKKKFQVIIPDPRGCGRSEKGDQQYSFDLLASDMKKLLDHLNIDQAYVIGHSMGGMVAQHLAYQHPSTIKKIVLFATSNTLCGIGRHCCKTAVIAKTEASLKTFIHVMAIWNFSNEFFSDDNNIKNLLAGAEQDPYPLQTDSLLEQMRIIQDFDSSSSLKKITAPALIIGCEKDIIFPTESVKNLLILIKNSQYKEIKGATHSVHIEQPGKVFEIISTFLM